MLLRGAVIFILLLARMYPLLSQQPIGHWREHLPYGQAVALTALAGKIYASTHSSFFSVDPADNTMERFSKASGLTETGISAFQSDEHTGSLIVAYSNSSIDILQHNRITTIDAIKRLETVRDKKINSIFCFRDKAYLCSQQGIFVIDLLKLEIRDTYVIGSAGQQVPVNAVCASQDFFYAACGEGLKKAPVQGVNLADFRNWQLVSGSNGLPEGPCRQVLAVQDNIIVLKNDSLFEMRSGTSRLLYASDRTLVSITWSSGQLVLCEKKTAGNARVVLLNADGSTGRIIEQAGYVMEPQQALIVAGEVWLADSAAGLVRFSAGGAQSYQPSSPAGTASGDLRVQSGALWAASGAVTPDWKNTQNKNGLYRFHNNVWTNYDATRLAGNDSLVDLVSLAIHPVTGEVWAGSFGGGLLQMKNDGQARLFKQGSFIEPSMNDPSRYNVSGLAFDREQRLWISAYGAARNLSVLNPDGRSYSFSIPFSHAANALSQIVIDDVNQKWIVSPNGNGVFCFNHGLSVENSADDQWKYFRAGAGNGNLPGNQVLCIEKDNNGFIWIGTTNGIAVVYCTQQVFGQRGCEAVLPVVQLDNFAGYLFSNEEVQCMAVDGADRKWVGTKNGAWLLNADATKIVYRFSAENSPLLSNDVKKITIDPVTGEVFFATASGICSFRSTATAGGETNAEALVFPNPVPPGYNGTIAIRGLVTNAIVKITEPGGRLVYQTRALGGQAVWNGRKYSGGKVSAGVYLVLVSDENRKEKIAAKIVIIH
jgi:ligand-binding sensor domain-containing protein